jgi:hypothetical protein
MGNFLGNLIGLLLILVAVVVTFFSLQAATVVFAAIAYIVFAVVWVLERFGRPPSELRRRMMLSDEQFRAYRRYHIFVNFSGAGQLMSACLNILRVAAIVWAILALWCGQVWVGAANAGCFFVFGYVCLRLDPILYMRSAARARQPYATDELRIISSLLEARHAWLASLGKRGGSDPEPRHRV